MDSNKRKEAPNASGENKGAKRSKGGSGGKWQTPHQKTKIAASRGHGTIGPGDIGIWATCARNQEGRATTELKSLLYQYAEKFYGIAAQPDESDDDDEVDIEASIRKEAAAMGEKNGKPKMFSPVRLDIECVLFFKTQPPIDPVDFVRRICEDIISSGTRSTRYINRLTPMALMGKATEKGLSELASTVLREHFQLAELETPSGNGEKEADESTPKPPRHSYAIRPTIRNHNSLKRDVVIKQVASLIGDTHSVNLTKPDKVILIEIYQTVCGMSVVGGDWETLKRYNLSELYQPRPKVGAAAEAGAGAGGTRAVDSPKKEAVSATGASTATDSLEPSK
ncbi:Uncharacterized protein BP5553_08959 [Venustampulla echinocandica]|uniref:THUMP domain-containing protein n=1 Tax=Venustampulla echinocandica TaxID=2656787 RepID=A0A370TDF6_9HELO|nr:Uncharacterized protein BP5553_08959 [Venustampulla echinocandica]RDL32503.1 Uncharacterized protein BP5553_08959 [Venustampulla echinocandica]